MKFLNTNLDKRSFTSIQASLLADIEPKDLKLPVEKDKLLIVIFASSKPVDGADFWISFDDTEDMFSRIEDVSGVLFVECIPSDGAQGPDTTTGLEFVSDVVDGMGPKTLASLFFLTYEIDKSVIWESEVNVSYFGPNVEPQLLFNQLNDVAAAV